MLLAVALTVLNVVIVYPQWALLGIAATWPRRTMLQVIVFTIVCSVGWFFGRGISALMGRGTTPS